MWNNYGNGNGSPFTMPVQPMYGGYGGGDGIFGGDGIWALLFILALFGGGWGGFGGFGWGGMGLGMMGMGMDGFGLYPWLNNSQNINGGFRDQMMSGKLDAISGSVNDGFRDVLLGQAGTNQTLCQTGNAITGAVKDGFYGLETAENARQMALLQQLFGIQSAQQQCCCENRAAIADVKYAIATEECATRNAAAMNTRDIIDNIRSGNQGIMDKLCQLELDNERAQRAADQREIVRLNNELLYARGQSSREAQSSDIVRRILTEMRQCPVPAQPVYGNTPIFSCNGGNGYNYSGCGCSGFNAA